MTENEAIKAIQNDLEWHSKELKPAYKEVLKMAIQALEEIQQYRAIGTVDGFRADKTIADKLYKFVKSDVDLLDKYLVIGTPEQCKVAVERMKPKKVLYREQNYGTPWLCPECEADQIKCEFFSEDGSEPQEKHTFCWKCGTVIDWSE